MKLTESFEPDTYLVTHLVEPSEAGIRLDHFLKRRYCKRSREQVKRAIESGAVTIQRESRNPVGRLKPSLQLIPGDEVRILSERKPEPDVCFDYKILYEDETLLIIDKPPNLPVHPAGRYFFNTLLVHLRTHGHREALDSKHEYFLVHRIDKETSGVLVLAKDKEVCTDLTRQFAERSTQKTYLAIVHGIPPKTFAVNSALKRSTTSLIDIKMMIAPESDGGQPALTEFKIASTHGNFSLVECFPKTGRQHQIRIHLESIGHPIVGDKLYGMPEEESVRFYERKHLCPEAMAKLILPRHALHAACLKFHHPMLGKVMEFRSPLPHDLQQFLNERSLQ